ncbi:MAG: PAS domain S-box protein [Chitinophagaceae bacterium]
MNTKLNFKNKKQGVVLKTATAAVTEDMLHRLAFDNSLQPNIISTVSSGKIILANSAACQLLGYSKKEMLTKTSSTIFDIKESSFKKMLKQRTSEGHSFAQVTAIKKSGKRIFCEITSAVFMDAHGVKKSITTIGDLSQSILSQKNIDAKKEKIVADNIVIAKSRQKEIDVINEKVVADNIVVAKSKQKLIDSKKEKIVADNIELARVKQKGIDAVNEKIVANNIILAQAKSDARQMEMEEGLKQEIDAHAKLVVEHEEKFKLIFNSSTDVLYDSDLITNKVLISNAYEKEFGYQITNNMTPSDDWLSHIYPDDKAALFQDFTRAIESNDIEWKYSYRFLKADNSVANVTSIAIILRDITGKAYRMIGAMQDNSIEQMLEEKLHQEIKLKEKQITEAVEDAKEMERSDIGKELHDNINQLLGVSKLYLDMAKQGGDNSEMYLSRTSEYTLTAIEEIRKLTKGLRTDIIKNLGLCEAIDNLCDDTMEVSPVKIFYSQKGFDEHCVNDKFKLNIYRIVQEQLNNILKHAKATKVNIDILQNKKSILFTITDNGSLSKNCVHFKSKLNQKVMQVLYRGFFCKEIKVE